MLRLVASFLVLVFLTLAPVTAQEATPEATTPEDTPSSVDLLIDVIENDATRAELIDRP